MKRAETVLEIRNVLLAGALTKEQLRNFYVKELRVVRGEDFVTEFARDLREDAVATPERRWFHRFLSGHPGVGKSTEFSRLEQILMSEFELVRINAQTELNPGALSPDGPHPCPNDGCHRPSRQVHRQAQGSRRRRHRAGVGDGVAR